MNPEQPLQQLYELGLTVGRTLDLDHETAVFMDWLARSTGVAQAALFVAGQTGHTLCLIQAVGLPLPIGGELPVGFDPWRWLREKGGVEEGDGPCQYAVPLIAEQRLLGVLCVRSRRAGEELVQEQRLVETAAGYLAPVLANILRYRTLEEEVARRVAELAESEARYRLLAETARDIILVHDMEGRILYVNQAGLEWSGYSKEEALGKLVTDFIPPEHLPALAQRRDQRAAGEFDRYVYETEFVNRHGERIAVEVSSSPVLHEGQAAGILLVARDVTWRKQAEGMLRQHAEELERRVAERTAELEERMAEVERLNRALTNLLEDLQAANRNLEATAAQLREANEELEAFVYSVSHDLRAPLRAMEGFAQALLEDYGGEMDPTARDYAGRVVAAAQRMDALIQDLLTYSRVSRTDIRLGPVDLELVVQDALRELEVEVQKKEAQIVVEGPLPMVRAHYTVLAQVVSNLISNAVKFVAGGVRPRVRLWAEERGQWVRLWVEDNGIGIPPEHHERVFRIFERLHSIETYPGTGVGLAIVKKGVERMGGRVGLESEVGQGSRFWIELCGAG